MSTLRVNTLQNTSTTDGGISIDNSGHVTIDGQVLPSAGPLSNRNLIINGAMQVAQRGTVTGINSAVNNYGGPDRFALYSNSPSNSAVFSAIQQSVTDNPGFQTAYRVDCTTAASSALSGTKEIKVVASLEAQNVQALKYGTDSPQQVTLSFWVRSNQTGTGAVWFYRPDVSNRHTSLTYTITEADTWERIVLTINGDSTNAIPSDNGIGFVINWILDSGGDYTSGTSPNGTWEALTNANRYVGQTLNIGQSTNDYFDITGVQLEVGSVATPFEHRSYGDELARCERYYLRYTADNDDCYGFSFSAFSSTAGVVNVTFPTSMRATPSFNFSGSHRIISVTDSATFTSGLAISRQNTGSRSTTLELGGTSSLTAGSAGSLMAAANGVYLEFISEL